MRRPYRPIRKHEIERIEARRKAARISCEDLAAQAGMVTRTYFRIKKSGRAFPRTIRALNFAIRSIERQRKS